ncbi:hypothetical protein NDU88_001998 [Pleurodeles waltl]|uniref:Uncharacterized protein n=1 Tax=Pleurodeles waltl TaxID=8319 RepID=A0AAV7W2Q5_PLEWA|nr:hypothetical protein NDU88_001998 [Pleurodeles waltl]
MKGGPGAPQGRRGLFPICGGRPGASTVLCAPPPGRRVQRAPTPWGATCLTHRCGRKARKAYRRGPTKHVAQAAAPLSPNLLHPGRGTDRARGPSRTPHRLPRPGEAMAASASSLSLGTPQTEGAAGSCALPRAAKPDTRQGPLRGTRACGLSPPLLDRRNAARGTRMSRGRPA